MAIARHAATAAFFTLLISSQVLLSPAVAGTVTATEADSGKTVSVPLNDSLEVKLTGQHNSGRYWRIDADLTPQLVLAGRTTKAVDVSGAPETTTFTFSADAPGTVTFRATYAKPGTPRAEKSDVSVMIDVMGPQP